MISLDMSNNIGHALQNSLIYRRDGIAGASHSQDDAKISASRPIPPKCRADMAAKVGGGVKLTKF